MFLWRNKKVSESALSGAMNFTYCLVTGFISGEHVGQIAIISRLNVTVFNEAVKKCCYSNEECKVAFVGVCMCQSSVIVAGHSSR